MEPHDALRDCNNSILMNGPCQEEPVCPKVTPTDVQGDHTIPTEPELTESIVEADWAAGIYEHWLA